MHTGKAVPLQIGPESGAGQVLGAGRGVVTRGWQEVGQEGSFCGHVSRITNLGRRRMGVPWAPQVIILLNDIHWMALWLNGQAHVTLACVRSQEDGSNTGCF